MDKKFNFEVLERDAATSIKRWRDELLKGNRKILDVPSGYGRNAKYLAYFGADVLCVDIDQQALKDIECYGKVFNEKLEGSLTPGYVDLREKWVFGKDQFDSIISVDFVMPSLVEAFIYSVKKGGAILIQTYGNRGENHLELPEANFYRNLLAHKTTLTHYEEKSAINNKVTVRLLAIKT